MNGPPGPPAPRNTSKIWKLVAGGLGLLLLVAVILYIVDPGSSEDASSFKPAFPPGGPVEFLYLDAARVATYLAQVEGGEVESEALTRKLTQNLEAKASLQGLGGLGATKASELVAERTIKPTAASSFFALRTRLEEANVLDEIHPRFFEEDVEPLPEGAFVEFKTSALLAPIYISAYLAVLHAGSLAALFPDSPRRRREATNFFRKVGPAGRAVFAIQPYAELPTDEAAGEAASASERKPFVYLLPVTVPLLSSERSLLKYGGGSFTVLGKLVRRFPERSRPHDPAYVDSATEETWEQALRHAPGELLCRTAPKCAARVRRPGLTAKQRAAAIELARGRILDALKTQASISTRGAVILPIAIYK
jgi:hypothetical protein